MATRRNTPRKGRSESEAWTEVLEQLREVRRIMFTTATKRETIELSAKKQDAIDRALYAAETTARAMKAQAAAGIHENPPLAVFALNSKGKRVEGKKVSSRVYRLEYKHDADGRDYGHDFKSGTDMIALPDGSILIRRPDGKSSWGVYKV